LLEPGNMAEQADVQPKQSLNEQLEVRKIRANGFV
jgi:hypothetical protein